MPLQSRRLIRKRIGFLPSPRGSVWNSLEVAALVTSAATPLAIFALGYVVTHAGQEAALKRESAAREEAVKRETLTRAETLRREDQRAAQALLRETQQRQEARRDAKLARDEAFQRERALRQEGDAREAALRRELRSSELWDQLLSRRLEAWTEMAPLLNEIRDTSTQIAKQDIDAFPEELIKKAQATSLRIDGIRDTYWVHFGPEFALLLDDFMNSAYEFNTVKHDSWSARNKSLAEVEKHYRRLMSGAARLLMEPTFSVGPVSID